MSQTGSIRRAPADATIAGVERQTGLSKDTLRIWERRYGFPVPARDGRGERVYPPDQVQKLRVISRLIDRGLRPGRLVSLSLAQLLDRLRGEPLPAAGPGESANPELLPLMDEVLARVEHHDEAGLRTQLSRVLLRLGLQRFVVEFVARLNERIGDAWSSGRIVIAQEHLYTEQIQFLLRQGIGSLFPAGPGPSVLLTTLPGEQHQLGLLMAHACLAIEGARCVSLGAQTPLWDIVHAARQHGVDVIGLSFSEAFRPSAARDLLEDLRAEVPDHIEIWAGGRVWTRARRSVPGVRFVTELTHIPELLATHRRWRMPQSSAHARSHV